MYTIPGAQSQNAQDLLEARFPAQAGGTASVVFQAKSGTLSDPADQAAIAQTEANLAPGKSPHVTQVLGPTTPAVGPAFVSKDGTIGYIRVQYDEKATSLPPETVKQLEAAAAPVVQAGLHVEFGGPVVDYLSRDEGGDADVIGLFFAVIILLIAFGSVVAMSVPIGTALFGLAIALSIISLVAAVTDIGTVAPTLATMIGLGVGIDYSLFIVTRHRQNLAAGMEVNESIGLANGTAGQAVLFAGGTVVIAITGLALSGVPYVTRLGLMSAIAVAVMMAAAVTLVPALLGLAGRHINSIRVPHLRRKARTADHHSVTGARPGGWERWATFMSRHRWPAVIISLAILLTLAAPVLSMRLGQTDDGTSAGQPHPAPRLRPHHAGLRCRGEWAAVPRRRAAATRRHDPGGRDRAGRGEGPRSPGHAGAGEPGRIGGAGRRDPSGSAAVGADREPREQLAHRRAAAGGAGNRCNRLRGRSDGGVRRPR